MKTRVAVAAALLAAVTGVAGCAGQEPEEISPQGAKVLAADVDAVEAAARAGDAVTLQQALAVLREHVDAQQRSGDLSSTRATQILAAGARVALDVGVPPPAAVPPSAAPTPRPASTAPRPATKKGEPDKGDGDSKDDDEKKKEEEKKKDD